MELNNTSDQRNYSNSIGEEYDSGVIKYIRFCPECNKKLYHTRKDNASYAVKKKVLCKECSAKKLGEKQSGSNNPFFGKKHSKETKIKMINNKDYSIWKTPEFKEKMRVIANNTRHMAGKSVYSVWLKKYGKEEADKRMQEMKEKQHIKNGGKNNPMFGKPSPKGAGNGWKGWYKNVFFRSLRELMILIPLIDNNTPYISLENKDYCVQYTDYNGQIRNYFGDFLINNEWIEIKPIRLQYTVGNKAKRIAAEEYCKQKGWIFKYIDPFIDSELIKQKYLAGDIKFQERYEEKIKKFYNL